MSYKRKFLRFLDKEHSVERKQTGQSTLLPQLVLTAVLAGGFVMQPFAAWAASTIIRGDQTSVTFNNNVADIYAEKRVNNTAMNYFLTYQLGQGDIANMHFRTATDAATTSATNLVNFVATRIDINGTVNAIQNSKIGGNLYFLSREGMVVGSSGVINAGALYVATPTETMFNNYLTEYAASTSDYTNINNITSTTGFTAIPVNASGTITVLGQINTTNDTYLRSAKIGVGKNVSGDTTYGSADAAVSGASIKTGITDFSNFVKLTDTQKTTAGITSLTATKTGNGDIVLTAIATERNTTDSSFASNIISNNTVEAKVAVAGTKGVDVINAAGDVKITATASSGEDYSKYFEGDVSSVTGKEVQLLGDVVQTKATIDIDSGTITGQNVNIAATSTNNFITGNSSGSTLDSITSKVQDYLVQAIQGSILNLGVSYAILGGEATVTVGENAIINANATTTGDNKALNITANSTVKTSAGATTAGYRLMTLFDSAGAVPTTAVSYGESTNNAAITIKGELNSQGDMNIAANAKNTLKVTATASSSEILLKEDSQKSKIAVGVAVATGTNNSTVELASTAKATAVGDMSITAASTSNVTTKAKGKVGEAAVVATAVNVTSFDSAANITLAGEAEAKNITADAINTLEENSVEADNALDSSGFKTGLKGAVVNSGFGNAVKSGMQGIFSNIQKNLVGETESSTINTLLTEWGKKVGFGASVAVANESNSATITIKNTAELTATNNLAITANNIIEDTTMSVTGSTSNDYTKEDYMLNASVLVANMDNSASVTVEGGTTAENAHAQLIANNITIKANSEFQYNRINKLIESLTEYYTKMTEAYAQINELIAQSANQKLFTDIQSKNTELQEALKVFTTGLKNDSDYANTEAGQDQAQKIATLSQELVDSMTELQSLAEDNSSTDTATKSAWSILKSAVTGPYNVIKAAMDFTDLGSYTNFYTSSSLGGATNKGETAEFAAAGSVTVTNVNNSAKVLIGQNSELNGSGKVTLDATVTHNAVSAAGKLGFDSGSKTLVGASVNVQRGDLNSAVIVGQGAKISGSAINLDAVNNSTVVGVVLSSGTAESNAISGMVSYMGGDSNSVIAVDDEAVLTATRASSGTITAKENDGSINLTSSNKTIITNMAGGVAKSRTQSAVGAAVAITNYDINDIAAIVNIEVGASKIANASGLITIVQKATGLSDDENKKLLGKSTDTETTGSITAHSVSAATKNDSVINTVTVTGSIVKSSDGNNPTMGNIIGTFTSNMQNMYSNAVGSIIDNTVGKFFGTGEGKKLPTHTKPSNPYAGQSMPSLTVTGAGSVSVNTVSVNTQTVLDGANITLTNNYKSSGSEAGLSVNATDSSFIGAWSGAAAISWKTATKAENQNNTSVNIAGAVGVNSINSKALAMIANSTIEDADSIKNTAVKSGAAVGAGLGLSVSKTDSSSESTSSSYDGAASVSVNIVNNDLYAYMNNNTVSNSTGSTTSITNTASDSDTQVTGGVNASLVTSGNKGAALGGTIIYSSISNDVQAKISGGTYANIGSVQNLALTDITQVSAAVGISVSAAEKSNYGFEGVVAVNNLNNTATATVENADMTVNSITVAAYDADLKSKTWDSYISNRGLDPTGSSYMSNVRDTTSYTDSEGTVKTDAAWSVGSDNNVTVAQKGNTIVTAAVGVTVTPSDGTSASGTAAISVSTINNDFKASITGSNITANGTSSDTNKAVNVYAKTDTLIVGVGAGAAAAGTSSSTSFGGAGSVTWNTLTNDTTATIANSTIKADAVKVNAANSSLLVNVAGQVTVGKTAVGLALAYNGLTNMTGAYIKGSTISGTSNANTTSVIVEADNEGKEYAIGAGVSASTDTAAANGTVAVNQGHNDTEAVIDAYTGTDSSNNTTTTNTTITNASGVTVTAADKSSLLAIAGGVGTSKGTAIGGAVAYNDVGGLNTDSSARKQNTKAAINNATISTASGSTVTVAASDASTLATIAAGVSVSTGGNAVEGAAATAFINKNVEGSMTGTTISGATADTKVTADTSSKITTSAVVVAASGNSTAVGAGLAVNRITQDTIVSLNNTKLTVANLLAQSSSVATILNIGVGGSGTSSTVSAAGSIAVNMIDNNTKAVVENGSYITSENNVVVAAASDENIANYAGVLSVNTSTTSGVAAGLAVSVNTISGSTDAHIDASTVTANAKGSSASVKDTVADTAIIDAIASTSMFADTGRLYNKRSDSTYSGVAVSSSSTHTINSSLMNLGVTKSGVAANGTVNVNYISGKTNASIAKTDVTSSKDVNVIAHDYTNSAGLVGTANASGFSEKGTGVSVGIGSDTNTMSRTTTASISGSATKKATISGSAVNVLADSKQGIGSLTAGISVALSATGGAGSGSVSVALMNGTTEALLSNATINAETLAVKATHTGKLHTLAVAVGASTGTVGAGIGVGVLKEASTTTAGVKDSEVTYKDAADGATTVSAENTTKAVTHMYNLGASGGVGLAGSVGVNNLSSKVNTTVSGSTFGSASGNKAGTVTISGKNTINLEAYAGTGSGGVAAGIGVGVAVNTIDSQVQTVLSNSKLYAGGTVDVKAEEDRTASQVAVNAAIGGTAAGAVNVMVTNVGKALSTTYETDGSGTAQLGSMLEEANKAISNNKLTSTYNIEGLNLTKITAANSDVGMGSDDASVVQSVVENNSVIQSSNAVNINATENTNVKMNGISASVSGAAAAAGTFSILNVHRNTGVAISSAEITGSKVAISTALKGASTLNVYQGVASLYAAIGAAYASVTNSGNATINLSNAKLTASSGNITVSAADNSTAAINAYGITGAVGGAASVIVAEGTNETAVTISVSGSTLDAEKDISITADREGQDSDGNTANTMTVYVYNVAGGLAFGGTGVGATAKEYGTVGITVDGTTVEKQNILEAGGNLTLKARNNPALSAETAGGGGSLLAGASVTVAQTYFGDNDKHASTYVKVNGSNNKLAAGTASGSGKGTITLAAIASPKLTTKMTGFSIGAIASIGVNTGGSYAYSDVDVALADGITYYSSTSATDSATDTVNLDVDASNTVTEYVKANGLQIGANFSTGTNLAANEAVLNTTITASGSNSASKLNDVKANASSYADITNDAESAGGSILADISPYAAKASNTYTAATKVDLAGSWQTAGGLSAYAINGSKLNLEANAASASIVNGSGTWLRNYITNTADVNLTGATITTEGAQMYAAENTVDYTGKLTGSGFGAINANATDYADEISFAAKVNIDKSTLTATGTSGSITALALTSGTINSKNYLASAGVIPITLAYSKHTITYDNGINVTNGSSLLTQEEDQDVTLASVDNTTVTLSTIADTQGGLVGAASTNLTHALNRSNKINVASGTTIQSAHDVNLYAGADENGTSSSLDVNVTSDAYNKTVFDVYTSPTLSHNMTQSNQLTVAGTVYSIRNTNLYAAKGNTTDKASNSTYNFWNGGKQTTSVSSTKSGTTSRHEGTDNYVSVTGVVKAGIHNNLTLTISGTTTYTATEKDSDGNITAGSYDTSGIKIEETSGADWFKTSTITTTTISIANSLMERYNTITTAMAKYDPDSSAYASYQTELNTLLLEMKSLGMVETHTETVNGVTTTTYIPVSSIEVLGIEIPNIIISGGNVNITTDKLTGEGEITAQAAKELSITNSSDMYLYVNDLTVQDAGGLVRLNDVSLESVAKGATSADNNAKTGYSFTGKISADGTATVPNIVIASTSSTYSDTTIKRQPDVGVYGTITNASGDVTISSDNYNILVSGGISARNIYITATKGSVTQTNTSGVINVGGDPLTQFQFSTEVAKKIQDYLNKQADGYTKSFADYTEYYNWLINEVGISKDLLTTTTTENAGIQAGGNVYINGLYVNIGGLIQSGYNNYTTTLTAEDAAKVTALDTEWATTKVSLSDTDVMSNDKYLINGGGAYYNSATGQYDYEVKVYYNPSTQQLLTESITPTGGKVYISGYITSTGNGRIIAADGAPSISIDTTSVMKDLTVNAITSSSISGFISISDNYTNKITEYKNGYYRSYDIGKDSTGVAWIASDSLKYSPKSGVQYTWTGGETGSEILQGSYTKKFALWGLIKYGTTAEFIDKIGGESQATYAPISSSGEINAEDFFLVNDKGSDSNSYLTITVSNKKTTTKYSGVIATKEYAGVTGKIFGFGTVYYTWTQSNGIDISSTTNLKADKDISVGFITAGSNAGNISIASYQDMNIVGNISNATVTSSDGSYVGQGTTYLTSENGSITTVGNSRIISDSVDIGAAGNVTVSHSSIGSSASVDVTSSGGDISFTSDKGDLNIKQVKTNYSETSTVADTDSTTATTTATTGNVYLQAAGSILNSADGTEAVVQGKRIDLFSTNGSIGEIITAEDGTKTYNALRVQAGTDVYSGDTMASSINATAVGDVVLTQVDGNMRLGIIVSSNGDAVLTVNNGSFVDAYNGSSTETETDTAEKIQKWLDAGLISSADDDSSSTNAGEAAYETRTATLDSNAQVIAQQQAAEASWEAAWESTYKADYADADEDTIASLKNSYIVDYMANDTTDYSTKVSEYKTVAEALAANTTLQEAKNTYATAVSEANGDIDTINAAYKVYEAAVDAYFDSLSTSYTDAERDVINSYAELGTSYDSSKYGYSANQLLYAIEDSILNSEPGTTPTTSTQANVFANNITLIAENGGIGVDGGTQVISYANLSNVKNLKILASAQAGDVTWSTDAEGNAVSNGDYLTIRKQNAIDVQVASGGTITAKGKTNVYLAGVKGTELVVDKVSSEGSVKLLADNGVSMLNSSSLITGTNLTIYGGSGSIGSSTDVLRTSITGTLYANSTGGVYITQDKDKELIVQAISTDGDVVLTANKGMSMDTSTSAGYIHSANGTITLTSANGSVGKATENAAMRIHNNGAEVNVTAGNGGVYLLGKNTSGSTSTSDYGTLLLGTITATDAVQIASEGNIALSTATDEEAAGSITTATGKDVTLTAEGDITLNTGRISGAADADKNYTSLNSVTLQSGGTITQEATAAGIFADSITTNTDGGSQLLSVNNEAHSYTFGGYKTDTINGAIAFMVNTDKYADNTLTINETTNHVVYGDIIIWNLKGNIKVASALTTAEQPAVASITDAPVVDNSGDIKLFALKNVEVADDLTAADNIEIVATNGAITTATEATLAAGSDVNLLADLDSSAGTITVNGSIEAGNNVTAEAYGNVEVAGTVTAEQAVELTSRNVNVLVHGDVTAEAGSATISAAEGAVLLEGSVTAGTDAVIAADDKVTVNGSIKAGNDAKLTSATSDIIAKGSIEATKGDVTLTAEKGSITAGGAITAGTDVSATSLNALAVTGNIKAGQDVSLTSTNSKITTSGTVTAGNDFTAKAAQELEADGNITATKGDVSLASENSTVTTKGDVTATAGNVSLSATSAKGAITAGGKITAGTDVNATATNALAVTGNIKAGQNASLKSTNNSITTAGGIEATAGNVSLSATSANGAITVGGKIAAGTDVNATATRAVTVNDSITANKGKVVLYSTAGDVTTNGAVSATVGSVELVANGGKLTTNGTINAGTTLTAYAVDTVSLNKAATAGTAVDVTSQNSSIKTSSLTAGTNVQLTANNGSITSTGTVAAGASVIADAQGDINTQAVTATRENILLTSTTGNITTNGAVNAVNGNVVLSATSTDATITANDTINAGSDVTLTADGAVTTAKAVTADVDVELKSNSSSVTTNSITAGSNVTVQAAEAVNTQGAVTATSGNAKLTSTNRDVNTNAVTAGSNVVLTANKGAITAGAALKAGRNITAQAKNALALNDTATAGNDITLQIVNAGTGSITVDKAMSAGKNIKITTTVGEINAIGDMDAGNNIALTSTSGKITTDGDLDASKNIYITSDTGAIAMGGYVTAYSGNVEATTNSSNITATGDIDAGKDIALTSTSGTITANGDLDAGQDVILTNDTGAVLINKDISAKRNVKASTTSGNITANFVYAGNDMEYTSQNGTITLEESIVAGNNITATTMDSDINFNGHVVALDGDITATITRAANKHSITFGGQTYANKGSVNANTANGDIAISGAVTAGTDITYTATDGSINIAKGTLTSNGGNINLTIINNDDSVSKSINLGGDVTANDGNINMAVYGNGNVDDDFEGYSLIAHSADGNEEKGNIDVETVNGVGYVNLQNVLADNDLRVDVNDGNIFLNDVNGRFVVLQSTTEGHDIKTQSITAGRMVTLQGTNIDIGIIDQRKDYGDMLVIDSSGAGGEAPMDTFIIGGDTELDKVLEQLGDWVLNNGIVFERIWANNVEIHLNTNKLYIEKLIVNNVAHISNAHTTATIWGSAPQRDSAHSSYWVNTGINKPLDNWTEWKTDGLSGKWMYLFLTDRSDVQYSNGNLLQTKHYHYVYGQRYSAVDWMYRLTSQRLQDMYDLSYEPGIAYFYRNYLYDIPEELLSTDNAAPEQIQVEDYQL